MPACFLVSDLHGREHRYRTLFQKIEIERPEAVFMGGDLLPHGFHDVERFFDEQLVEPLKTLRAMLRSSYPRIFVILGNDDGRLAEKWMQSGDQEKLWHYIHQRKIRFDSYTVYGYSYVPPTPFLLKDWERYDVSRYVDPGSISPEEGRRTVPVSEEEMRFATIQHDLEALTAKDDLSRALFLFHTPPYQTVLDRAALDGKRVDYAPLDVHVGSIAVRRFIETRQPLLTLHGHVHESARLTGSWREQMGTTWAFSAAHDGAELALIRFDPNHPETATRELIG